MHPGCSPLIFSGLEQHTRDEVRLWNWYCRFFPSKTDWKSWCAKIFSELLERPSGHALSLVQHNRLQPEKHEYNFVKDEIRIGRALDNDIVLVGASISKHHSQIFLKAGNFYLEDLDSTLGTYRSKKKLTPHQPVALRNGDEFAIFPYSFTVKMTTAWVPESHVDVYAGDIKTARWSEFAEEKPVDYVSFEVPVYPTWFAGCLQASQAFLNELLDRALHSLDVPPRRTGMTQADTGILEFLLLSLLEKANKELNFPFQFALNHAARPPRFAPDTRGLAFGFSLGLSQLGGAFRLFLPYQLLGVMEKAVSALPPFSPPLEITWRFPVSVGYVDLTADELRHLEPTDVLLFNSAVEILFPKNHCRGWKALLIADNPWSIKIDNYFERSFLMEESEKSEQSKEQASTKVAGTKPDLKQLPVLLHVVIGEKEMTLAEANGLAHESILELDRTKSDPVDLAINGKFVGKGELVEVEGKLGVKILSWRTS